MRAREPEGRSPARKRAAKAERSDAAEGGLRVGVGGRIKQNPPVANRAPQTLPLPLPLPLNAVAAHPARPLSPNQIGLDHAISPSAWVTRQYT